MNGWKEYLYRLNTVRPGMVTEGPSVEEASILEEHVSYLAGLTDRGVLLLAGRTQNDDDSTFGVVIFRARSDESARDIMNGDPAVEGGIMKAELFPFKVAFSGKAE